MGHSLTATGSHFSVLDILMAPLRGVGRFCVTVMGHHSRIHQINNLRAKSADALAEMGLTRDEILHHVMSDLYYL